MKEIDNILYERLSPDIYCFVHNQLVKLQQENQQLKDNWSKLKAFIVNEIPEEEFVNNEYYVSILDKMVELERGVSDVED